MKIETFEARHIDGVAALLAHARERRLRAIYLDTIDKFLAAHRFYGKNGFELIDPDTLPPSFPRMKVDSRFYRLRLDSAAPKA